jgi:hypothetical protein
MIIVFSLLITIVGKMRYPQLVDNLWIVYTEPL